MADPEARTVLFEDLKLLPPVNSRADLPAEGARFGHTCLVREEDRFYRFDGEAWQAVDDADGG
jgi:hypothetical protein